MYTPTEQDLNTIKEVVNNNVDFSDAFLKELLVLYSGDINQVMEALLTGDYATSKTGELSKKTSDSDEEMGDTRETANDFDEKVSDNSKSVDDMTAPTININTKKSVQKSQLNKNIQYTTINMFDETDVAKHNSTNTPMFIVPKNCYNIGINYFNIFLYSIITNYTLPQDIVDMTLENSSHYPQNTFVKFIILYNAVKTQSNNKLFQDTQYYTVPSSLMDLDIEIPISETFSILIKSFINDYFILKKNIETKTSTTEDDNTEISASDPILNMLISTSSYYTTQQNVNNLYCMHFPQEEYTTNLNKMLNNLFLNQDNYESSQDKTNNVDLQVEQSNRLLKVSDVFTVIFDQEEYDDDDDDDDDDDMSLNNGNNLIDVENNLVDVDVPIIFYPELYTTPILKIIEKEIAPQLNSIKTQINELNVKLNMKLKYYQGAPVLSFLNTCLKYLSTEEDSDSGDNESVAVERRQNAIKTLNTVKQNLSSAKLTIIEQINVLKQQMHALDLNSLELSPTVVDLINKSQNANSDQSNIHMNVYKLVALIISSNNYFILNSKGKYTNYVVLNNTLNFNDTQVDDKMLHQLFKEYITTSKKEPIMCVYTKQENGEIAKKEDLIDMS
ncbi:hypothetical protein ACO0RG_004030 [Hanseniaspora osmophila]